MRIGSIPKSLEFLCFTRNTARKNANANDFEFALDRITMGIGRKKMFVSDKDKLITAYHEGLFSHLSWFLCNTFNIKGDML